MHVEMRSAKTTVTGAGRPLGNTTAVSCEQHKCRQPDSGRRERFTSGQYPPPVGVKMVELDYAVAPAFAPCSPIMAAAEFRNEAKQTKPLQARLNVLFHSCLPLP
jgi:hypothetical protein